MGTSIELCIGSVSLSYSKNTMGRDYGFLFQGSDINRRKSNQINYDYYEQNPDEIADLENAEEVFSRKLSQVIPRLELLGFTLDTARNEYEDLVAEAIDIDSYILEGSEEKPEYLSFEEFCNLACRYPIDSLKNDYIEYETPDRESISQGIYSKEIDLFRRIPTTDNSGMYWSEASYLSAKVCILSAESMLQVFSQNPENSDVEVTWGFGAIVDSGWVERVDIVPGARRKQKILIATEGASDARIIQRTMNLFRPDVADFFNFVDGNERHHFWGTGNLVKFAEGLIRIDLINQVIFVLDNDAEGHDALRKLESLKLPENMRALVLPNLDSFQKFKTRGPEGIGVSNINGRAAAIECYLDLRLEQYPPPQVTWSNFKKDINAWHGSLDYKESYSKYFHDQTDEDLLNGNYDKSKLLVLIETLIHEAGFVKPVV